MYVITTQGEISTLKTIHNSIESNVFLTKKNTNYKIRANMTIDIADVLHGNQKILMININLR